MGAYAIHRRRPLAHHAALMISASTISVEGGGTVHSFDHDTSADCAGGGTADITGVIGTSTVTELNTTDIQGTPEYEIWPGGYTEMLDSIGLRWDVLSDPEFPIEFDGVWPNWASLPADSFPIVRQTGWLSTNEVGRGVLIVDGMFDPDDFFEWDGIVIAKDFDDYSEGQIRGMVIAGLSAPNFYQTIYMRSTVQYHSCNVYEANETLSYLELIENTVFEAG